MGSGIHLSSPPPPALVRPRVKTSLIQHGERRVFTVIPRLQYCIAVNKLSKKLEMLRLSSC